MNGRNLKELSAADSLRRLAGVPLGRVIFTRHALPAVRPVNHVVADGQIVIRSSAGTILSAEVAAFQAVVAFEADELDVEERLGWNVVVTGFAQLVQDPGEAARLKSMIKPWVMGQLDQVIRIRPQIITGYELVPATVPG
ncbi:pyridoxamine 5'-phosphate oxidase family protein [Nonomuraea sp. NPDC051941]|uniref:pyridoxamine 5'-phosphate oxidase family protein n=1 Tax=Nonomuraea sp. NPDC051941 TaxID=3364373 RepID=UPI0037C7CC0C